MLRLYGRAPRGQRLVAPVPHGHWKTTTFQVIAANRENALASRCTGAHGLSDTGKTKLKATRSRFRRPASK